MKLRYSDILSTIKIPVYHDHCGTFSVPLQFHYITEHEIRTETYVCQHTIKLVLTFAKDDQTLVEICTVALYFDSDTFPIKLGFAQVNPKSTRKMFDV